MKISKIVIGLVVLSNIVLATECILDTIKERGIWTSISSTSTAILGKVYLKSILSLVVVSSCISITDITMVVATLNTIMIIVRE